MLRCGERAGVDFIGVHARTRHERNVLPHHDISKDIVSALKIVRQKFIPQSSFSVSAELAQGDEELEGGGWILLI